MIEEPAVKDLENASLRVALLEDDAVLRERILSPRLRDHGFDVIGLGSAAALERLLLAGVPDIIVLDVGLPDADGFDLAQSLRSRFPAVGVVMLTGRESPHDKVRGLVDGADAYLTKPVELGLLAATLHSLARRLQAVMATDAFASPPGWRLAGGGWRLMAPCGQAVLLTRSERPLVRCLIQHAGQVVGRDALIATLTSNTFEFDTHRLDSLIHRLRRKVAAASAHPFPLSAVHGAGYVFAP
ncbi:response regulator transcription factor [Stenotrophomonas tumulicola]